MRAATRRSCSTATRTITPSISSCARSSTTRCAAQDIDTTLLAAASLDWAADHNRALLWPLTVDLLAKVYPQYRDWGLTITLPWQRTFETQLDVRLGS